MRWKYAAMVSLCIILMMTGAASDDAPSISRSTTTPSQSTVSDVTTQNGYTFGQGTYYVAARRQVPSNWGNARSWYALAEATGYAVGDIPKKGAIAWTDHGPTGQVALVEDVSADDIEVVISEMNYRGNWNRVTFRKASASSFKYIYLY